MRKRLPLSKEDVALPTVVTKPIVLVGVIEVYENRNVALLDLPGAAIFDLPEAY